jgi:hypothetical protein
MHSLPMRLMVDLRAIIAERDDGSTEVLLHGGLDLPLDAAAVAGVIPPHSAEREDAAPVVPPTVLRLRSRYARVLTLYRAGVPVAEIAADTGYTEGSVNTIVYWMRKFDPTVPYRFRGAGRSKKTDEPR